MTLQDNHPRVLIVNPFGIGDVLFTTPIIRTLKDKFTGIRIGYLCNRRTAPILENNPYVDSVFIYERDELETIRQRSFFFWLKEVLIFLNKIKKEKFDLALDFSLNTQYGFFCWYAGIKNRIGYNFKKRGGFLTKKINLSGYSGKHIVEYYTELLKLIGVDSKYKNLELYLKEEDRSYVRQLLAKNGIQQKDYLVGVIPGAGKSWGKEAYLKHWPAENYAQLADKIIEKYEAKVIIMGGFSEKDIATSLMKNMKNKALNLCGLTTVGQLAALLSMTKVVITNDGGPLHMAVALGVKTVSFFGPVDPKVYGPYPDNPKQNIVLRKDLECSPCYTNFRLTDCLRNKQCLREINMEQVMDALNGLFV